MDKKTTDIIAYFSWVGLLVAFLIGDKDNCKFHINQSLIITIASSAVTAAGGIIAVIVPLVGGILVSVLGLAVAVFWIMGFVNALQGVEKPLPFIGDIKIIK